MNDETPDDATGSAAPDASAYVPLAVTDRSGFRESIHHGALVGLTTDGSIGVRAGDVQALVYPRSSTKPVQAFAMLANGLRLEPRQLALACASHDGTERHVAVVHEILDEHGLTEDALANTPDLPINRDAADAVLAAGRHASSILQNCSGKHSAMLTTCLVNGWPLDTYLEFDHPLQVAITEHIDALGGPVAHVGVDGCGAPAHVIPLIGLARAFRTLAMERGPIWSAMSTHPELIGGEHRDDTRLMRMVPGLMAKGGAEGVFAAALPDGRAVAVKIADGANRAASVVLAAALTRLGVDVDATMIGEPIMGHGRAVGSVTAILARPT